MVSWAVRKKQLSLALALSAWVLSTPTLAQKTAEPVPGPAAQAAPDVGEGLRKACAAWREEGPSEVLKVALRVPALRYDEGTLAVTLADRLALPESPRGTMDLVPDAATDVDSELAAAEASRLMRAQADGKLQTELYFELVRGRMNNSPCLTIAGGRHLRVTVAPLAIGLSQGGREQLRLLSERGAVVMPQGKPELLIDNRSLVYDGDPQDRASIEDALRGLSGKATACYQRALQRGGPYSFAKD